MTAITSSPARRRLQVVVATFGTVAGAAVGFLAGAQPLLLGLGLGVLTVLAGFFTLFEPVVLGLLVLRSALDIFNSIQLPTVLAIGIDVLTLLYVVVTLLRRRSVHTDGFWWFYIGWVTLQGLWPVLTFLNALGQSSWALQIGAREWLRLFSLPMIYLLVMQLKGRIAPSRIIDILLLSLIAPVAAALMQEYLPASLLPGFLKAGEGWAIEGRASGTFGHANTLAAYLLLFLGVLWWRQQQAVHRWPWIALMGVVIMAYVGTHSLVALVMLVVLAMVLIVPRLSLGSVAGGIALTVLVFGLFASTEFGRERLTLLLGTPLLNPNIDVSRAILLAQSDYNSFNWRLAHWTYLLQSWQKAPLLGHGLATGIYLSPFPYIPHNDYLRALVEGGWVGLGTFLSLLVAQLVRLLQLLRSSPRGSPRRDLCFVLLGTFLATSVAMATDNIWICTAFYFYWWTLFAIAGWQWDEPAKAAPAQAGRPVPATR